MSSNVLNFNPNAYNLGSPTDGSIGGQLGGWLGGLFGTAAGGGASGGASPTESGGSQTLSVTQISGDPVKFLVAIAIIIVVTLLSGDYWWIADILLIAAYGAEEKSNTVTNMFKTFTNWIGG